MFMEVRILICSSAIFINNFLKLYIMVTVGIDFDNTIINYDNLIHKIAVENKLISDSIPPSKKKIRDYLRTVKNGEIEWQKIQAVIYGARIMEAEAMEGVLEFIAACLNKGIKVYIISHKTTYSNLYKTGTNLRGAALTWMEHYLFFDKFSDENVFFESTMEEKIKRISELKCDYFIDDMEELFMHGIFPSSVKKVLFSTEGSIYNDRVADVKVFSRWKDIHNYILS